MVNRVRGLNTPMEDRPDVEPERGHVPIKGPDDILKAPNLTPVQQMGDYYSRPAPRTQSNVGSLVEALNMFGNSLQGAYTQKLSKDKEDIEGKVERKIAGKTDAEIEIMRKSDPEFQNKLAQKYIGGKQGITSANRDAQDLQQWAAANPTASYEEFEAKKREIGARANLQARDPSYAKGYASILTPTYDRVQAQRNKAIIDQQENQRQQLSQDTGIALLETGIRDGKPTDTIVGEMLAFKRGNKDFLNQPYNVQDQHTVNMINTLSERAERDPKNRHRYQELAERLATDSAYRDNRGALIDSTEIGDKAKVALAKVRSTVEKANNAATTEEQYQFRMAARDGTLDEKRFLEWVQNPNNRGSITEAQAASIRALNVTARELRQKALLRQQAEMEENRKIDTIGKQAAYAGDRGELNFGLQPVKITNAKGQEVEYTVDDQKRMAIEAQRKESDYIATARGEDNLPLDQRIALRVTRDNDWFVKNGEDNPAWKDGVRAGAHAVTAATTGAEGNGGQLPEVAERGYHIYKNLSTVNPQMLSRISDKAATDIYGTAMILEKSLGLTPAQALARAARAADPNNPATEAQMAKAKDIDTEVEKFTGRRGFWSWLTGNHSELRNLKENAGFMEGEVKRMANVLIKSDGMGAEEAVKAAASTVAGNYTSVNGWAVRVPQTSVNTVQFRNYAQKHIKDWHEKHGKAMGVDIDDVGIRPEPGRQDAWEVVIKRGGRHLSFGRLAETRFDINMVRSFRQQEQRENAEKAINDRRVAGPDVDPAVYSGWDPNIPPY